MDETVVDKVLSIDIKVLTSENKEVVLRYTDFKNLEDMTISREYKDDYYCNLLCIKSLKGLDFYVKCNGYSFELVEV